MLGLPCEEMRRMMAEIDDLVDGAVQRQEAAKAAIRAFADDIRRRVPEIARIVGKSEAEHGAIPEVVQSLTEQISRWRSF